MNHIFNSKLNNKMGSENLEKYEIQERQIRRTKQIRRKITETKLSRKQKLYWEV